ncbi:MAG: tRNA pseudouridine(55) synthase TruB, partial [Gammaproteobacteria bacterium]|nr:tRNA pseudouridine(55) synthase TruB [Gammaproteobacteria bacterium]
MGRRGRKGRNISGILLLDKPPGMTSNAALQVVKRLFNACKAGHTGSLDPLATGVLPLCFGEATKFSQFLLDADKKYLARVKLGVITDSGDADGEVLERRPVPEIDDVRLEEVLQHYRGDITQIPSMFSALKVDGQPLYKLARKGIEVERKERPVSIYRLEASEREGDELTLLVHCSKGTYVRTLVEDIGKELGPGAHVIGLRRLAAGPFDAEETFTMSELEA